MRRKAPEVAVWTWEAVPGTDERAYQGSTPGEEFIAPRVLWESFRWVAYILVWEDGRWLSHEAGGWRTLIQAQAAASREAQEIVNVRRLMEQACRNMFGTVGYLPRGAVDGKEREADAGAAADAAADALHRLRAGTPPAGVWLFDALPCLRLPLFL